MGYTIRTVAANAPTPVTVPDDLDKELSELYTHLVEHPDVLPMVEFEDTDDETAGKQQRALIRQIKSWGTYRTDDDGNPAPLNFRKVKGSTDTALRFRLTTPEQDAAAAAERETAKAAREAKAAADAKAGKK